MFAQPCTVRTAAMEVDFPGGWKYPFLFCGEQALQLFWKLPGYQLLQGFNPAIAQSGNVLPGFFIQWFNGNLNGVGLGSTPLNQSIGTRPESLPRMTRQGGKSRPEYSYNFRFHFILPHQTITQKNWQI